MHFPFFWKNEKYSKYFINKLVSFTSGKVKFNNVWNTRDIQLLFTLKGNVQHLVCLIYKVICSFSETIRN